MIKMVLTMSDDAYDTFRNGINFGILKLSLDDLKFYGITINEITYCEDKKND